MGTRSDEPAPDQFLGSLEAAVMEAVWNLGESSVQDVLEAINDQRRRPLAYNTVMSVMARLAQEKGLLLRRRVGRAFVYDAAVSKDGFATFQAGLMAGELLDDYGSAAVAGFVRSVHDRPELRRELERLMGETDGESR